MWHVSVRTREGKGDAAAHAVERDLAFFELERAAPVEVVRLYLLEGPLDEAQARRLAEALLIDDVVQTGEVVRARAEAPVDPDAACITVSRKAGVMDPVEESIRRAAARLDIPLERVRSGFCHRFHGDVGADDLQRIGERLLANPVVDDIAIGVSMLQPAGHAQGYAFSRIETPLPDDDEALLAISKTSGLALDLEEMRAIRAHFRELGRAPTDVELETLAQTWSEHCKHKTFAATVEIDGRRIENLLKSTIFASTATLDRDFCVSVFKDNAGIVRFDDRHNLCFKVETHNHPSAIEPYGGAGTGLGGVIRDILGTGLGGRPVANLDVFCVGFPDADPKELPAGVIHPMRVLKGVVSGVRDYGNRMGIPTVAGAVFFDERYTGNPLVYCGTVGLIPADRCEKKTLPGDLIVALGGATGRDGIHGATFSSRELHEESESMDGGAVQIGNAITEKRTMDVLLTARDRGLFRNVTDCGAGGFSSAVGEMGEETGARVELSAAPLKYPGLSYREIWLSEAQERMVLAVPPEKLDELLELCASEDVDACVLGSFTDTGRLELLYGGERVADLAMAFLHDGLPKRVLKATWQRPAPDLLDDLRPPAHATMLERLIAHPNVASKEWIIRQYDHEVQSGSAVKSLVGVRSDAPGDAAVHAPVLGSTRGFALGCGLNPHYADVDPYLMAKAVVDEAIRNVVAVGGDPDRCSILDNFSWGNTAKPDRLGALVRAAEGCQDAALALKTPFISGKDSLNNEYATATGTICIPHTLLISAVAIVDDVRRCVTMDAKKAGDHLYVVGTTADELGGSLWLRLQGRRGDVVPVLDDARALATHRAMHRAIAGGLVRACHDPSEGGLAVALAEQAFAGDLGVTIDLDRLPAAGALEDHAALFSESLTRYLVEVAPENARAFEDVMAGLPCARVGAFDDGGRLKATRGGRTVLDVELEPLARLHRESLGRALEGGAADHASRDGGNGR